jgi:hypothetical protein
MEAVDPFALWSITNSSKPSKPCVAQTRKVQRAASMPHFHCSKDGMTEASQSGLGATKMGHQQPKRQPHSASAGFLHGQQQKDKSTELAMPKRQRRVCETLASLESYSNYYSDLSHVTLDEAPTRAFAEQRAMCDALSRPRAPSQADELAAEPVVALRTATEQRSYCSRLSHKPPPTMDSTSSMPRPDVNVASQRRSIERLTENVVRRTASHCPSDLSDVDRMLSQLRGRKRLPQMNLTPDSPRHQHAPLRRPKSGKRIANLETESNNPELSELRNVVEELLWVSLLTLRSCPGGEAKTMSKDMTSRLNGIILDVIVPVLQPMARFVLPSGSAIVKRLQNEWPELTSRLRLHAAAKCAWDSQELRKRSALVRECRDLLLAKEFTKTLAHRLDKLGPETLESSLTAKDISSEASLSIAESDSARLNS